MLFRSGKSKFRKRSRNRSSLPMMANDSLSIAITIPDSSRSINSAGPVPKVSESLHVVKARLAEVNASAVEKVKVAARTADDYVHDNPWQSIGVAAALGLALGVLISRR